MKPHSRHLLWFAAAVLALLGLLSVTPETAEKQAAVAKVPVVPKVGMPTASFQSGTSPLLPAAPSVLQKAAPMTFDALAASGVEVRREEVRFEAQSWEPDLHQAYDLPAHVRLQRRSVIYQVPGFSHGLVRVDTVRRASPSQKEAEAAGEPLWQNAMIADHLMVQVEPGITEERLRAALPAYARIREQVSPDGLYLVEVPAEGEGAIERAMLGLKQLKGILKFVEPDCVVAGADTVPDDPLFGGAPGPQWHLPKISAPRAWDVIKNPKTAADALTTVVAIVDTGVDITHPDLLPNIWTNPIDSTENGVDEDNNLRRDDFHGWNFVENNNNVMDDVGHGTLVAGIVGAVGNNAQGVSGVCWGVKLLPIRIIRKQGTGTYGLYSWAVSAMRYIRDLNKNGRQVAVANHSWGGAGYSPLMLDAINNPVRTSDPVPAATALMATFIKGTNQLTLAVNKGSLTDLIKIRSGMTITGTGIPAGTLVTVVKGNTLLLSNFTTVARTKQALTFSNPVLPKPYGMIHVAAAGNKIQNTDRVPVYPACIPSGFVLSVGASDAADAPSLWPANTGSNVGQQTVDLFAPGTGVLSTKLKLAVESNYGYESRNGTSMAAPLVSGAAALLTMWQPQIKDQRQIKQIILDNVDPVPGLATKCASGGRLNVARILDRLYQPLLVDSGGSTGGVGATSGALSIGLGLSGQVAKGDAFSLAIREGQVSSWGWGYYGQTAGDAAHGYATAVPGTVPDSMGAVMVSAAGNTGFMLKGDGTVWAWGGNHDGLLANGSTDFLAHPQPVQVSNLWTAETPGPQATWISAGGHVGSSHVTVVNADGTVWAWGRNDKGQLGDGTQEDHFSPVAVPGLDEVVMTAVGTSFTLALRRDGTVWQWGRKPGAEDTTLGNLNLTPTIVLDLSEVTYIAAGYETAYAVLADGTVKWWGDFDGDPSQTGYPAWTATPTPYQELSEMVGIAAGNGFALGVDALGRVYAWGRNDMGQLGAGLGDPASRPVQVPNLGTEGVGSIAAGRDSSIVLLGSGEVAAWGRNQRGELGGGRLDESLLPVQVPGLSEIATARAGRAPAAAARNRNGAWYFWGQTVADPDAQLPTLFTEFSPMADLQTCPNHDFVLARKTDGNLWTWGGANTWGQFGDGSGAASRTPSAAKQVKNVSGVTSFSVSPGQYSLPPGDPLGAFEASLHCLALNKDGTVRSWGRNNRGQLGDGTAVQRPTPVAVSGLTDVVEVSAGGAHSLARRRDGTVWAWGENAYGQLGDGTTTQRMTPVQVAGLSEIVQIEAGRDSNAALKTDGSVWVWGAASGITSPVSLAGDVRLAVRVLGLPPLTRIDAGGEVLMGIDANGAVWAWSLYSGLLGRRANATENPWTPARVEGISQITDLSVGESGVFAVRADGTLWAWGNSESGFLGDGSAWSATPVFVLGFGGVSRSLATIGAGDEANSWQLQNFPNSDELRDSGISDDTADPDGDRFANLLEYALDLDPNFPSVTNIPTPVLDILKREASSESAGGGQISLFTTPTEEADEEDDVERTYFGLSIPRVGVRQGIEYIVEVSTDLIQWRSGEPDTFTITDNADLLLVYASKPIEEEPNQFIRLRVQRTGVSSGVSVTSPVFSSDLKEVWQFAFGLGSSIVSEPDGSFNLVVTANPAPSEPVLLRLTLAGTAKNGIAGDYTTTTAATLTFDAEQTQAEIPITLVQDAVVESTETLIVTLLPPETQPDSGFAAVGLPNQHVVTILDDETRPQVLAQPESQFAPRGGTLTLASGFEASPAAALQWLKNGTMVGGARTNTLSFAKLDLTNAGAYSLRATNVLGAVTSESANLAIVDTASKTLSLAPGATTTLKAEAAGKDLTYEWFKDDAILPEGAPFSGVKSPALKITSMTVAESGAYKCVVSMGDLNMTTGVTTLRVIDQAPVIQPKPVVLPDVVIGSSYGPVPVPVDPETRRSPVSFTATGLPPGLKLDPVTGLISGRPTARKSTPYAVTLKATNKVSSDTAPTSIFVRALPADVEGVYTGFVARQAQVNGGLGGRLDLTVSATGTFTGKLLHGLVSYPLKGSLDTAIDSLEAEATVTIPRKGLSTLTLSFTLLSGQHRLGTSSLSDGSQSADVSGWRQRWSTKSPADSYKGYYTLALPSPAGPATQPQGAGFASFTILPAGTLTVAGKLADGVGLTTGTFVGPLGEVLVHQAAATADIIVGSLTIAAGTAPSFADSTLDGTLTWSRFVQAASQKVYRGGFAPLTVAAFGGRYTEPATTAIVMGLDDVPGNARLVFTGGDFGTPPVPPDITLRIQPKGVVVVPTTLADNPRKTTLTVTPKTGVFKGGMTLKDGGVTRSPTTYEGLIVTEPGGGQRGYGFLLVPKYPAPSPAATDSALVILEEVK